MSDYKYPCVMRAASDGIDIIVKFTAPTIGTVIGGGQGKHYSIGYHSGGWNMEFLKPYTPAIIKR